MWDMPPATPTDIAGDLGLLRERGPWRAHELPVEHLKAAADALGTDVISVLRAAAARITAAEDTAETRKVRSAAEALYGLTNSLHGRPLKDRRDAAAGVYCVTPDYFRHHPQEDVIAQLALNIVLACEEAGRRKGSEAAWSASLRELLDTSVGYARDMRVPADLLVTRTMVTELIGHFDEPDGALHVVYGEAGCGKSTVLWTLREHLAQEPRIVPLLLPATWIAPRVEQGLHQQITDAVVEISQAESRPVFLFDTVDLMLHDEQSRQALLRLLDALVAQGVTTVVSSRPREAVLIDADEFVRHELHPYDEIELEHAVASLVRRYTPTSDADDITDRLQAAEARGLPIADVCRSPLLLRMLFDLSAPLEPELTDIDVTTLFGAYWQRRVQRDVRLEAATRMRIEPSNDESQLAGQVGIALLSTGLAEIPEDALTDTLTMMRQGMRPFGIDVLDERGVLITSTNLTGFFHQAFFEFAAAKGILATRDPGAFELLGNRTVSGAGDLFVGCVLEQLLILAGRDPGLLAAARAATSLTVGADGDAVQAIGLAAWAHHPDLLPEALPRLRDCGPFALERAARILPSIANKKPGQALSQLLLLWQAAATSHLRAAVLAAMARLALRAPEEVAAALEYLDPVRALQDLNGQTGDDEGADEVRHSLLGLLETIRNVAPRLVRSTLVAMLSAAGNKSSVELAYMADQWPSIGDENLLDEILRVVAAEHLDHATTGQLGALFAASWRLDGAWNDFDDWAAFVEEATTPGSDLQEAEIETTLCAVQHFIATLAADDARARAAIDLLLGATDQRTTEILSGRVLHGVLDSESPVKETLVARARDALATVGDSAAGGKLSSVQDLLLSTLTRSQLPDGLVGQLLPRTMTDEAWFADDRLSALMPAAAKEGNESALDLIGRMSEHPDDFADAPIGTILRAAVRGALSNDDVYHASISIALASDDSGAITQIIAASQWGDERLAVHFPSLFAYARSLLDDGARRAIGAMLIADLLRDTNSETFDWNDYRAILDDTADPDAQAHLINAMGMQSDPDSVLDRIEYLRQHIDIDLSDEVPVRAVRLDPRTRGFATSAAVANASAQALLRTLAIMAEPDPDNWPTIRALALHEPDAAESQLLGIDFLVVCNYLQRLAAEDPSQAAKCLLDLCGRLADETTFIGYMPALWEDELGAVVRAVFANGLGRSGLELIGLCGQLDPDLPPTILATIAERHYREARDELISLSHNAEYTEIKAFVNDLVRDHDRSVGTRVFPELLEAVQRRSASPM